MCCKFSNLAFSSVSRKTLDQVTTFEMQGGKKTLPSPHSADWAICSRSFQTMSVQSHHAAKDTDEFHAWLDFPCLLLPLSSSPSLLQVLLPFLISSKGAGATESVQVSFECLVGQYWVSHAQSKISLMLHFETNVVGINWYVLNNLEHQVVLNS